MRGGYYVPMMENEADKVRDKKTYRIAEEILGRIKEKFQVEFPDSEIGYIAIHLEGKKMLINTTIAEETEGNLIISPEISDLVGFMLSAVYDAFIEDVLKPASGTSGRAHPARYETDQPSSEGHQREVFSGLQYGHYILCDSES